eukprot:CAMPEP_0181499140 /NCGR_PEP_ID=MMETSP1110-20121109/54491_1 /TAXON_ID=174948 /ORGANISM="Symbiodinium sp., Strain CCMP421" /LENGTH=98 /DNA_ID=CAMNT_0023627289 /DNA_START=1 /DNA_END=297 /DNA_ORIENTATION=-
MVLWNIVVIGLCYAVRLLSYLNLARVASFPLMGLVPVVSGAIGVLPTRDFSGSHLLGILLCLTSVACFQRARHHRPFHRPDRDGCDGYAQLSDGPEEI